MLTPQNTTPKRSLTLACAAFSCGIILYFERHKLSPLVPTVKAKAVSKLYNRSNFNPVADVVDRTGSAVVCIETANSQLMRSHR